MGTTKILNRLRKLFRSFTAGVASASLVLASFPSEAGTHASFGGAVSEKPTCNGGGGVTINKPVTVIKPVSITKTINVFKPVVINKNISIVKQIDASKSISIEKNIDINKTIEINKTIIINKGQAIAQAEAQAFAAASASASAQANVIVYGGGYQNVIIDNRASQQELGAVQAEGRCEFQDATVVKAIHAVCIAADGHEFPASHMIAETWIDSSFEGEVARCIPGAHLKIVIGDVLQSDQGMAGTYEHGTALSCAEHEALRHFKDGMLKCAPALAVPDCTERTNLRRYGSGDFFFSFRSKVCVTSAAAESRALDLSGMPLEGGVGSGY